MSADDRFLEFGDVVGAERMVSVRPPVIRALTTPFSAVSSRHGLTSFSSFADAIQLGDDKPHGGHPAPAVVAN